MNNELLVEITNFLKLHGSTITQSAGIIVTAIATVVLALLTGRYVRLTKHMLDETKASRGPNVYVDLELTNYQIKLLVGNCGSSPAHNIAFAVTDSIPWREKEYQGGFNTLRIIKDGITYLAPGRVLKYIAGTFNYKDLLETDSTADFTITYEDHFKKKHKMEFLIDMNQYKEILFESFKKPESEIASAIEKMERSRKSDKSTSRFFEGFSKKQCPQCGELISSKAKKCRYCMEYLSIEKEEKNT